MRQVFIYEIRCRVTGRLYIGSTVQPVTKRWNTHIKLLRRGRHWITLFQQDWTEHGEPNFWFSVLETCTETDRDTRETEWIKSIEPDLRYNVYSDASPPCRNVEEMRRRGSEILKRLHQTGQLNNHTPEWRKNQSAWMKHLNQQPEVREKIQAAFTGEHHAKMIDAYKQGVAKGTVWTPEQRAKHGEAIRKKWAEPGFREKTRKAMSEGVKKSYQNGRMPWQHR